MATVNPTIKHVGNHTVIFTWSLTNADNDGAPIGPNHSDFADRNVQAFGTFGGGSVLVQGSNNDGGAYHALDDPQGTDISFSGAGGKAISEVTELTRPLLSGGAGSTVTVVIACRRNRASGV